MGTATAIRDYRHVIEGLPSSDARARLAGMVQRHEPAIHAVCRRIVGDEGLAIRIAREAVRELCQRLPDLADVDVDTPWTHIFRIAQRRATDAVRRPGELLIQDGVLREGSREAARLRVLTASQRRRLVRRALGGLDPPVQEIAYLRYVENLPHDTIAAWLDESGIPAVLRRYRPRLAGELCWLLEEFAPGL